MHSLVSGLALSQLVFLASYIYYSSFRRHRMARILLFFLVCLASFLLGSLPLFESVPLLDFLLSSLAILTPGALWLFSIQFFSDEQEIPGYGIGLILVYFIFRTVLNILEMFGGGTSQVAYYLGDLLPLLVMVGLSLHVIYMGIEGRRDDLLEERRRLRIPFVICMGIVTVFTLAFGALSPLLEALLPAAGSATLESQVMLAIYGSIFLWALVLNLVIVRFDKDTEALLSNVSLSSLAEGFEVPGPIALDREQKLMSRINRAMREEKLFREAGLTISELGNRLSVPEYKLRSTINQAMGFRNFNQFLNRYRITEAARLLADSDEPIANIAMDVGYNSLSSFNKAFKEIHKKTPREFRSGGGISSAA